MNAVRTRGRTQILRPENVRRSQRVEELERHPNKEVVYVNEKRKPASVFWISSAVLIGLAMLFSFGHWVVKVSIEHSEKMLASAERQSERAHELALTAVTEANKIPPETVTTDYSMLIVVGFIGMAVIAAIVGMARGVAA